MSDEHSARAALVITEAVERFRDSVSPDDRAQIENTELKDVLGSLISIQQDLQNRRENRNLRKLYPFVQGLERYSGAIDTLSNGLSPYLPWVWAPIKLMLRITLDYLSAFDKLIDAYGLIATTMPRLKNLGNAFKDNPALLTKLAVYYVDVLEFHRRAYKFVRRKSWMFFFNTTWANFDFRFNSILDSMKRHSEAVDQEAATMDIIEAKQWREKLASQVAIKEKNRAGKQRQSVVAWLALENTPGEDSRERLVRDCLQGSCDWVMKQEKVASWANMDSKLPVLWLHGKPGAGKSVICASLIDLLQARGVTAFSYFCKYHQEDTLSQILKTLVLKIIETNPDLATIAYTEFVQKYHEPSLKVLRAMLTGSGHKPGLIHGVSTCRIVIDGLDECDSAEQKYIIEDLLRLTSVNSNNCNCKLLISSRDVPEISRSIRKKKKRDIGVISLSQERDSLNHTIKMFVESRLKDLVEERASFQIEDNEVESIIDIMTNKADGMFLWAKLVLDSLLDVDSIRELHAAITSMPKELPWLYARILGNLAKDGKADKVMRVLAWLALAKRPLKRHELVHGASLTPETRSLNRWDMFDESVIDKCKPLVEELPDGSIAFIHFTVEEYLRTDSSVQRLDSTIWEETIAFACVTVLKDGLYLLDPETPKLSQLLPVLNGSFALLPYAVDFWLDHVLVYASTATLMEESVLGQALSSLQLLHGTLYSSLKPDTSAETSFGSHVTTDSRLETLSHLSVYSLCASTLAFRAECQDQSANNGREFEELTLRHDSTLFTSLSVRFTEIVTQILSESFTKDGVSKDQIDRFRKQYLQLSLRCRFAPCIRASLGFASEPLRALHEQLHVKRLFCDKPDCSRGRIGFKNQKDLEIHERTYHQPGGILVPPSFRKALKTDIVGSGILRGGVLFSPDKNIHSALPATTQQSVSKYKALLPFDLESIQQATSKWSELRQNHDFAVMLNEKLKSSLDVNLMRTFQTDSVSFSVDISPDDRLIATGCYNQVQVFDIRTGETRCNFKINIVVSSEKVATCIKFYNNGSHLAVGMSNGYLMLRRLMGSGQLQKELKGHELQIYCIAISANNHTIITSSRDQSIAVWDLRDENMSKPVMILSEQGRCPEVAISPDSRLFATSCDDNFVRLRTVQTGELLRQFSAHKNPVCSVEFSPDGRTLISSSLGNNSIITWDIDLVDPHKGGSQQPSKEFMKLHRDGVMTSQITTDGRWIISGSADGSIAFWDAETGEPHLMLLGNQGGCINQALGHSSRIFASFDDDHTARVWSYNV